MILKNCLTHISKFVQGPHKFCDVLSTSSSPDGFVTLKGFRKCVIWRAGLKESPREEIGMERHGGFNFDKQEN